MFASILLALFPKLNDISFSSKHKMRGSIKCISLQKAYLQDAYVTHVLWNFHSRDVYLDFSDIFFLRKTGAPGQRWTLAAVRNYYFPVWLMT